MLYCIGGQAAQIKNGFGPQYIYYDTLLLAPVACLPNSRGIGFWFCCSNSALAMLRMLDRGRPRFFDQVGHETMYASSGNKHFFTKTHVIVRVTKIMNNLLENLKFVLSKSFFCVKNWSNLSEKKKFYEEYLTRRPTFIKFFFENFDF
jgi:hypothetical protein